MRCWWLVIMAVGCTDGDALERALAGNGGGGGSDAVALDAAARRDGFRPPPDRDMHPDRGPLPADAGPRDGSAEDAAPQVDAEAGCRDDDGDGYGIGCAAGLDCDEGARRVHPGAPERCNGQDDDCDQATDEGLGGDGCEVGFGACRAVGITACDGVTLVCSARPGTPTAEVCNEIDDDCDGPIDEQLACQCVPQDEVCNGVDDDCDGGTDEGLLNACGGCGPVPVEVCNARDDDCDGMVDEAVCRAWVLGPDDNVWSAPLGLNAGPLARGLRVDAAATLFRDTPVVWAFVGNEVWAYDPQEDVWADPFPIAALDGLQGPVDTAFSVPEWWNRRNDPQAAGNVLTVSRGQQSLTINVNLFTGMSRFISSSNLRDGWRGDDLAPNPDRLEEAVLDLRNGRGFWVGRPNRVCPGGEPALTAVGGVLSDGQLHVLDAAVCMVFVTVMPVNAWGGFRLPNAPNPAHITGWTHIEPEAGGGTEVIFVE